MKQQIIYKIEINIICNIMTIINKLYIFVLYIYNNIITVLIHSWDTFERSEHKN